MPEDLKEIIVKLINEVLNEDDITGQTPVRPVPTQPVKPMQTKVQPKVQTNVDPQTQTGFTQAQLVDFQKQIKNIKTSFRESSLQNTIQEFVSSIRDFNKNITQHSQNKEDIYYKSATVSNAAKDLINKLQFLVNEFDKLTNMTNTIKK
jgi:hypothetical protein